MTGPGQLPDEQDEAGWTAVLRSLPREGAPAGFAARLEAKLREGEARRQALVRTLFIAVVFAVVGSGATLVVAYAESAAIVATLADLVLAFGFIGKVALAVLRYAPGLAGTIVLVQCALFLVGFASLIGIFRRFSVRPAMLSAPVTAVA